LTLECELEGRELNCEVNLLTIINIV